MTVELTAADLDLLIESLEYSELAIDSAKGTPPDVHKQNRARVDAVADKLRRARRDQ